MSWSSIQGHDAVVESFARAAGRNRLAHAYLFVGPPGIGKRLFARQLAKTLLCESPPERNWDSCDKCPACLLVDAGTHPDLFQTARPEDKHEFPIKAVQQLCADLALKPARGRRKVAILDDADDLSEEAANCFLKTLEEPSPGSILVLIGTNSDRQLPTIRSRCQVIPFSPLPVALIERILQADAEIEPEHTARLARICGGSPGMVRELAEPAIWDFRCRLLDAIGSPTAEPFVLAKSWHELVEEAGKDSAAQRRRALLMLRLAVDGLRGVLNGNNVDPADKSRFATIRNRCSDERLAAMIERSLAADEQIEPRRVQLVLVLESLVDSLVCG